MKHTIKRRKKQVIEWEKILVNYLSDKGLECRIYKEIWSSKGLKIYFIREDTPMTNKHTKHCLISLFLREIQIKPQWDTTTHPVECLVEFK